MSDPRYYDMINGAAVRVLLLPMSQPDIYGVCETAGIAGISLREAWHSPEGDDIRGLGELFIPWVSIRYVQVRGPEEARG